MQVQSLSAITLSTDNMDGMLNFYFELNIVFHPKDPEGLVQVATIGPLELRLKSQSDLHNKASKRGISELTFTVHSLQAMVEHLNRKGYPMAKAPDNQKNETRVSYRDPDGNLIILVEPPPPACFPNMNSSQPNLK